MGGGEGMGEDLQQEEIRKSLYGGEVTAISAIYDKIPYLSTNHIMDKFLCGSFSVWNVMSNQACSLCGVT